MPTPKYKILIIDDDFRIRALLQTLLEVDYKVLLSENPIEGYKIALSKIPTLIILDLLFPGGEHGFTTCQKLKENPKTKSIPIIILTGSGLSNEEEAKGLKLGAEDYIEKPFDIKVLKERIKNVLNRTKKQTQDLIIITIGDISLISFPLMLKIGKKDISLTTEEYYFMYLLLKKQGSLVEYKYFCKIIWKDKDELRCKKALFCITDRLRAKLGKKNRNIITTIKNRGFIFDY